jgi:hypothetical protein
MEQIMPQPITGAKMIRTIIRLILGNQLFFIQNSFPEKPEVGMPPALTISWRSL